MYVGSLKRFKNQHFCLVLDDISHLLEIAVFYSPNELAHSRRRCYSYRSTRQMIVSTLRMSTFFTTLLSVLYFNHPFVKFDETPAITDGINASSSCMHNRICIDIHFLYGWLVISYFFFFFPCWHQTPPNVTEIELAKVAVKLSQSSEDSLACT